MIQVLGGTAVRKVKRSERPDRGRREKVNDMDAISANDPAVLALEELIDRIVAYNLAAHKQTPAKVAARQRAADFQKKLALYSAQAQKTKEAMIAARNRVDDLQDHKAGEYYFWKSKLDQLEHQGAFTAPASFDLFPAL